MPTLYHGTTAQSAKAILEGGFRDGTAFGFAGVWLSDIPLDSNDVGRIDRETLLAVVLDDADLAAYEVIEEGGQRRHYREWFVPAELINAKGKVRLVAPEENLG